MQGAAEQRQYWLSCSVALRRKLAYAIAHREEENNYRIHDAARKIMCGLETPFDHGWTLDQILEFFSNNP